MSLENQSSKLNQSTVNKKVGSQMNDSISSQTSYRQDYVLTSCANYIQPQSNYLTPISPNMYQLNGRFNKSDGRKIFQTTLNQEYRAHQITPHPLYIVQQASAKEKYQQFKANFDFKKQNKENLQQNFNLYEPGEYEKMFQKKLNLSEIGLSSGKKSQKSVSRLSNQSRKFIQDSVQKSLAGQSSTPSKSNSSSSNNKSNSNNPFSSLPPLQSQYHGIMMIQSQAHENEEQLPHEQNTTKDHLLENGQIQQVRYPSSQRNQTDTYSTDQINYGSASEQVKVEDQYNDVPSFQQNQEVIDYFLTQQDEQNSNNNSEEGIQLLSQLKSELNSLINGSAQNSQTSSKIGSKGQNSHSKIGIRHGQSLKDTRVFKQHSKYQSSVSKRCDNALQELDSKLQELKLNIYALHSKVSSSVQHKQGFEEQQTLINKILPEIEEVNQKQTQKQPEIYFQSVNYQSKLKKLIYPDSKIIFSRNDGQFIEFNDEISKILDQSFNSSDQNQNHQHTTSQYLSNQSSQKSSYSQSSQSIRMQEAGDDEQEHKSSDKFDSSSIKISLPKSDIQHMDFKMSNPKFYDFQKDEDKEERLDEENSQNLAQSCVSSASNETFTLQEINNRFNSKFNQLLQFKY